MRRILTNSVFLVAAAYLASGCHNIGNDSSNNNQVVAGQKPLNLGNHSAPFII